jgi:hypothetical protein
MRLTRSDRNERSVGYSVLRLSRWPRAGARGARPQARAGSTGAA